MVDWRNHITSDAEGLSGRPVIRGTRLSVDFLLGLTANGWSEDSILENYPQLKSEDLRAMYAFSAECLSHEGEEFLATRISA